MKRRVALPEDAQKSATRESGADFRSSFGERLGVLLDQFRTRTEASDVAGVVPDQLAKYVRGHAKPPLEVVARLCEAKGFSLDWLTWGSGNGPSGESVDEVQMVPVWDIVASSGTGRYAISEQLQGHLGFSKAWLRSLNIPLNDLHVVFNSGDSNAPAINDGDAMLLQRGVERIIGEAFYIFDSAGLLLVKEIERRVDGSIVLRSRNPDYGPQIVAPDQVEALHVFGRVVWAGGTV